MKSKKNQGEIAKEGQEEEEHEQEPMNLKLYAN